LNPLKKLSEKEIPMTQTVARLYDDFSTAQTVVRDLKNGGFPSENISLVAHDVSGEYARSLEGNGSATEAGAGVGAALGGLGGLLVGLGALAIPGIGPVVAAGPLATAVAGLLGAGVGALAGGVTGGLIGALVDMGVPETEAQYYSEGVRRGGTLVTVRAEDNMVARAREIMDRYETVNIHERSEWWRERGWTGYQANAQPYTANQVAEERNWYRERYGDYSNYDSDYRRHYETTFKNRGRSYDYYAPAYRYGYMLGTDERYRGSDWTWARLEPEARRGWENRMAGDMARAWDDFKEAVRYGWERVKQAVTD
jgi:hypothetical protein